MTVRKSKIDQEGEGRQVAIPFVLSNAQRSPVTAVRDCLRVAGIGEWPMFRTFALPRRWYDRFERLQEIRMNGRDIAPLVQRTSKLAGVEGDFAGYKLAGGVREGGSAEEGARGRYRAGGSPAVGGYVRRATLFADAPLTSIMG